MENNREKRRIKSFTRTKYKSYRRFKPSKNSSNSSNQPVAEATRHSQHRDLQQERKQQNEEAKRTLQTQQQVGEDDGDCSGSSSNEHNRSITDCLPIENLSHIFAYLPLCDVLNASLVCRKWRRTILNTPELWRNAELTLDCDRLSTRLEKCSVMCAVFGRYIRRMNIRCSHTCRRKACRTMAFNLRKLLQHVRAKHLNKFHISHLGLSQGSMTPIRRTSDILSRFLLSQKTLKSFHMSKSFWPSEIGVPVFNALSTKFSKTLTSLRIDDFFSKTFHPSHHHHSSNEDDYHQRFTLSNALSSLDALTHLAINYQYLTDDCVRKLASKNERINKSRSSSSSCSSSTSSNISSSGSTSSDSSSKCFHGNQNVYYHQNHPPPHPHRHHCYHHHRRQQSRRHTLKRLELLASRISPTFAFISTDAWKRLTDACPTLKVDFRIRGPVLSPSISIPAILDPAMRIQTIDLNIGNSFTLEEGGHLHMASILRYITSNFRKHLVKFSFNIDNHRESIDKTLVRLVRKCKLLTNLKGNGHFSDYDVTRRVIKKIIRGRKKLLRSKTDGNNSGGESSDNAARSYGTTCTTSNNSGGGDEEMNSRRVGSVDEGSSSSSNDGAGGSFHGEYSGGVRSRIRNQDGERSDGGYRE